MSTTTMSKPQAPTIEVTEHEAIVKALREAHAKEISELKTALKALTTQIKQAAYNMGLRTFEEYEQAEKIKESIYVPTEAEKTESAEWWKKE